MSSKCSNNTKKAGVVTTDSMCLGVVQAWVVAARGYAGGVAGGNGMIVSGATQARPNLSRLLARYGKLNKPGFTFTSIQVNKDYESAIHTDKNNLGPSAIIGLVSAAVLCLG